VEGNCFHACIASMLEVPIGEVSIDNDPNSDVWFQSLQDYLKPKNLFFLEVRLDVSKNYPLYAMDGVLCLMSGKSPREFEGRDGVNHCVVGVINSNPSDNKPVIFEMLHDPHPDNLGLKSGTLWGLGFIMALDPSKPVDKAALKKAGGV